MKSFPILSLSLIKKRDHLAKKKEDIKKTLRERRIERRNKLSSSLFRTVTTCPSLSCMSLTGTPTPFPLRPTLLVLMTTGDTLFLNNNKEEEENRS